MVKLTLVLAMVNTNTLQYAAATQRTPLHCTAAHLTAANMTTGQKDDLSLDKQINRRKLRLDNVWCKKYSWYVVIKTNTVASMQTTHSELPGPSTGLGAEGVTGVPTVAGELEAWKTVALGSSGGVKEGEAIGTDAASSFFWAAAREVKKMANCHHWYQLECTDCSI